MHMIDRYLKEFFVFNPSYAQSTSFVAKCCLLQNIILTRPSFFPQKSKDWDYSKALTMEVKGTNFLGNLKAENVKPVVLQKP